MAPRGPERGFTRSILCSLHRGPLMRDWRAVTQNTQYTKAALWTGAQDSAALSNTHGVTFPCSHSAEGQSQSWPNWVFFFVRFASCCPILFDQRFFFFLVGSCFETQPFFRELNWDCPSYYALQWIPAAHWLACGLRTSPSMFATGRNLSSLN